MAMVATRRVDRERLTIASTSACNLHTEAGACR
jgi:hypothetical protein